MFAYSFIKNGGDTINSFIEYYYHLDGIKVTKSNEKYTFSFNNDSYEFIPVTRSIDELFEIDRIIKNLPEYYKIQKNIYNRLITRVYEKEYILIKKNRLKSFSIIKMLNSNYINYELKEIDKSSWIYLWCLKVDNIEYQLSHIRNKFHLLDECIAYYIGMAENAIIYVKNSLKKGFYIPKKVSHIRMDLESINDPQNVIIDYHCRDVAEYFKYIFFTNNYTYEHIKKVLYELNYDEISLRFLYARLLFPTFFFDVYDGIINNKLLENEINNINNKMDEYEDYLNNIYTIISGQKKIPRIPWV